jgi:uncharacterized protein DUF2865
MAAAGACAVACLLTVPHIAHAGILDFIFGGFQQQPAPPASSYADPPATAPSSRRGPDGTREEAVIGGGGRYVGYCVRLCDGHPFPLGYLANATPVETCRAMCPASPTKVFFGSGVDHAVTREGQRYADIDNAYLYRERLVPNCTCNGRDAFGLARFDATSDPTLRAGDMVATKGGIQAYTGRRGQGPAFSPVDEAAVAAELTRSSSRSQPKRPTLSPAAEEEPGATARPDGDAQPDTRGQATR